MRYFNRWRLVLSVFLLVYVALLVLDLDYMAIQWDETPHLNGGLLLSRGHIKEYIQVGSFYPPLFDVIAAFYLKVFSPGVFSSRLVATTFGVLSVCCVFEFAFRLYGPRNALVSSVLLASMPGFIWLCRIALIETMLVFFFSLSLIFFFFWMRTGNDKMLFLGGVTLGLGFLVKYQALVGGIVMFVSVFLFCRERILAKLGKFSLMLIIFGATVMPWIFLACQKYASGTLGTWLYVLQVGSEEKFVYSTRFPIPIFYLIEMTYPYVDIHPISLPIYIFGLLGLGLWFSRRKLEDKFSLTWFFVVYFVFTAIPNKHWRYVTPVFPILAVSASDSILFIWDKANACLRERQINLRKRNITKVATAVFSFLVIASVLYSSLNAYSWVEKDHFHVPVEEASRYVAEQSASNETVVVLCALNLFNVDMVKFYLQIYNPDQRALMQYPEMPVDAYKPIFNVTELIERCEDSHAKYLLLYEYGTTKPFYQSELTVHKVLYELLYNTDRFALEKWVGDSPRSIVIISFS